MLVPLCLVLALGLGSSLGARKIEVTYGIAGAPGGKGLQFYPYRVSSKLSRAEQFLMGQPMVYRSRYLIRLLNGVVYAKPRSSTRGIWRPVKNMCAFIPRPDCRFSPPKVPSKKPGQAARPNQPNYAPPPGYLGRNLFTVVTIDGLEPQETRGLQEHPKETYNVTLGFETIKDAGYDVVNPLGGDVESPKTLLRLRIRATNFSEEWIRRNRRSKNAIVPIWYPLPYSQPKVYIRADYNVSSQLVSTFDRPCGRIPSDTCFRQMLEELRQLQNASDDGDLERCALRYPPPIPYNLPRWSTGVSLPGGPPLRTDSFVLSSIVASALTTHHSRYLDRNCTRSLIPVYALYRNVLRIGTTRSGVLRFLEKIPEFAVLQPDAKGNASSGNATGPPPPPPADTIPLGQFRDFGALMYVTMYAGRDPATLQALHRQTVLARGATVETFVGGFRLPHLYNASLEQTLDEARQRLNLSQAHDLNPLLLDYLDSLALYTLTATADGGGGESDVPHERRTGSVALGQV